MSGAWITLLWMLFAAAPDDAVPVDLVGIQSVDPPTSLEGAWRCNDGDDEHYADASFDDGAWATLELPQVAASKVCGSERSWVRRHLRIEPALVHEPLGVSVGVVRGAYEVFADGERIGGHGTIEPFVEGIQDGEAFLLPADAVADGDVVIAVRIANNASVVRVDRTWRLVPSGPLLVGRMPSTDFIAHSAVDALVRAKTAGSLGVGALFLLVALYHVLVWAMRRDRRGYLWFGCFAMIANVWLMIIALSGTRYLPIDSYTSGILGNGFVGTFVNIVFIEFFHWFLLGRAPVGRWRALQGTFVVIAFLAFVPRIGLAISVHPVIVVAKLALLIVALVVFVNAARRGSREARVLLVGFALAALLAPVEVYVQMRGLHWAVQPAQMALLLFVVTMAVALVAQFTRTLDEVDARNAELEDTNRAIARFVPFGFLSALEKTSVREVRRGESRMQEMAVLFSDLRDFTTLAEGMGADETFGFINDYLAKMEPEIYAGGGFINQYLGDGIMALFPRADEACDGAVASALGMMRGLAVLNAARARHNQAPLRVGIGIHAGPLMIGTIGGGDQLDAGVVGDAVNAAARLEGMTKIYGATLLISGVVAERLKKTTLTLREIDVVRARGKQASMCIVEVLNAGPLAAEKRGTLPLFAEARALYTRGDFGAARRLFEDCLAAVPEDGAARILSDRCVELQRAPPADWTGVFSLLQK